MYTHRFWFRFMALSVLILSGFSRTGFTQKIWTLEDCINYATENNLDINKQLFTVESNKEVLLQSKLNKIGRAHV